ncbi:pickpocket protein 28-like [Contarinia nasturtii]|uniref:pickpocket protein 28-like n=1 Tax=Contarinia nasturtii TaxID=265458 RepID=UPI0012D382CB|nr:pickpocket protein 28-like [Contarinia nasturtii]
MSIQNIFDRIWSIFAFGLSLYFCGCLNQNIGVNCDTISEYASFEGKLTPVWSIPFPAVTICPETKSYKEKLNITDAFHRLMEQKNMTEEELLQMQSVLQICDPHLTENFSLDQEFASNDIYSIIKNLAPNMFDTLFYCKWRNKFSFCYEHYKPVLTEEGLCFTFNALDPWDIYTDEMAKDIMIPTNKENYNEIYPHRGYVGGAKSGLFTLLRLYEENMDYVCRGPVQGFKVLLHHPAEVPQISKYYFRVPLSQEVLVSVKPQMITTSEKLQDYSAERRQCYFKDERQLRFFKVYTQRNCELECLSNFTKNECGCVKFSMPRDTDTPICGFDKIKCYQDAEDTLYEKVFVEGLKNVHSVATGCNCMPSCTSISYDADISEANFSWEELFGAFKNPLDEFNVMGLSRLSIFFKEPHFMTLKRSELLGPTDSTQTQEFSGSENSVEDRKDTNISDNLVWDDIATSTEENSL